MSTPKIIAASRFVVRPAICRTEYPLAGGNHILHVSVTEARASRDGWLATSRVDDQVGFYLTRDDNGRWSAQRVRGGVAANFFYRTKFRSQADLIISLPQRAAADGSLVVAA